MLVYITDDDLTVIGTTMNNISEAQSGTTGDVLRSESGFRLVPDTSESGVRDFIEHALASRLRPFDKALVTTGDIVMEVYDKGGTTTAAFVNNVLKRCDGISSRGRVVVFSRSDNLWHVHGVAMEMPMERVVVEERDGSVKEYMVPVKMPLPAVYEYQQVDCGRVTRMRVSEVVGLMFGDLREWFADGQRFTAMDAVVKCWQEYGVILGARDMKAHIMASGARLLGQRRKVAEAPNEFMFDEVE